MDEALLVAAGVLVILLNVWLIPRRQGFQQRYARRGMFVGVGLIVLAAARAAS